MLLAMTWYLVSARKWFKGPRINITHLEGEIPHSRSSDEGNVVVPEKEM